MLSDLHLIAEDEDDNVFARLKKLCTDIRKNTSVDDLVLFVILGDIADKGVSDSYNVAEQCLDLIKGELNEYSIKFEFVPGNHDLEKDEHNLIFFDKFISRFCDNAHTFDNKSVYSKVYDDVNFIFADSTLTRQPRASGRLDLESISAELIQGKTNVLFCHHALMQTQDGSHDNIENPYEVYEQLNKLGIEFLFHGHTHRTAVSIPENGMIEIGCGSLTGKTIWEKGLYNQFAVACIQDGKITYIERWVDTSDGGEIYAQNRLYPKVQDFADPNTVLKNEYLPVENYINRTVISYADKFNDSVARLLFRHDKLALNSIVRKYEKVLLLSDAGMGKSLEIQNLAYELCKKMHTVLYSLKDYTNQEISEILPLEYRKLSPHRYAILFDGYDEMNVECREMFEKKLRAFINDYVGAHIVITSRNNFCHIENGKSIDFDDFEVFLLENLDNTSICKFLEVKGVDVTNFIEIAKAKNVYDMLSNPFYLTNLAEIFIRENDLPEKSKLMETLVEKSFSIDDKKFSGNLEEQYHILFVQLEKVAIAMQMMHKKKLDDRKEYQKLFQLDIRELSKRSSLLSRNGNEWEFSHNNFREYLSARFVSKLTCEQAISLFCDGEAVKPSWVNTLGYLTGMELSWNLLEWMIENSPSSIVKFEPDRVSCEIRKKVFESIFCKYEKQSLYINDDLCNEYELAAFAHNPNIINFLLDRISNPRNITSQYSAINILRNFTSLFGLDDEVRNCLVNCCDKYPITPKHVCRMCLLVLAEKGLGNSELTKHFVNMFGDSEVDYIRLGMYEYLAIRKEHNSFVQLFLDGIKYINYRTNEDSRIGNEQFELVRTLKQMSTPASITSILKYFTKEKNLHFHNSKEVIKKSINTAIELYKSGYTEMYDIAFDCYINAAKFWNNAITTELSQFFLQTDTLKNAFVLAAEYFDDEPQHNNSLFYTDSNAIEYLKEAYLRNELKSTNVFHENVKWYVRDVAKYEELANLIKERECVELPIYKEPIDYERLRFDGRQKYLDCLFAPKSRDSLLAELVDLIGDPDILASNLLDVHHCVKNYSAQWYLQSAIYRNAYKNIKVTDFFKFYDADDFIIHEVSWCLDADSKLNLDDEKKDILKNIIKNKIDNGIFVRAIEYHDNNISMTPLVREILKVILFLEYNLEENVLLELTELPDYLFDNQIENKKYEYLEQHLEKKKIKKRLEENVASGRVENIVLSDHFNYFASMNDASLCKAALKVCKETREYSYVRTCALEYLYKTLGATYIADEILPVANGDFLVEINETCKDIPRDLMCETMEKQYRKTPNLTLLAHMIAFGSCKGLKQYYKMVKFKNRPPENEGIYIDGPTAAIEGVGNPKSLPILKNILCVAMRKSFSDLKFRGLTSTITKAFVNCGYESYDNTIKTLKKCLRRALKNEDSFRLYNYIINEVERAHRIKTDIPLTLGEVENYFLNSMIK